METAKRLGLSSALAGLAGIILTLGGLFLPWGSMIQGVVLISLNGLQANYVLTGNFYVMMAPCVGIFGYFLLLTGKRKAASAILAAEASFVILQTVMWLMDILPVPFYYSIAHTENIGPYTTLIGSSFMMFAALLSLLQHRLSS